jgi:predicted transcriptional regulator
MIKTPISDADLLALIHKQGLVTIRTLCELTGYAKPSMQHRIAALHDLGLVSRSQINGRRCGWKVTEPSGVQR